MNAATAHIPTARMRRSGRAGFTLVEVLATLVLLGIVVPVAMRGVSVALAAAQTAKRTAEATSLAQSKLNEMIADGSWQTSHLSIPNSTGPSKTAPAITARTKSPCTLHGRSAGRSAA